MQVKNVTKENGSLGFPVVLYLSDKVKRKRVNSWRVQIRNNEDSAHLDVPKRRFR